MKQQLDPIIGNWYTHEDKGQTFQIIEIEDEGEIEIQHIDGDLEAVEGSEWMQMDLVLAAAPEDWTGPIDDIEYDDLGYSETAMSNADHEAALSEHHDAREAWQIEDTDPDRFRDTRHEVPLRPEHC